MADDEFDPAAMSRRSRSRRSRAMRGFPDAEDPTTMADDEFDDATMADDEFDPAAMADDEFDPSTMADDNLLDDAVSSRSRKMRARRAAALRAQADALDDIPAVGSRSRRSRGRKNVDDLELRIQALELLEAPGESMVGLRPRAMKSYGGGVTVTRDEGDQPGRYAKAFKAYLTGGMDKLDRYEKQLLVKKGERRWDGDDSAAVMGGSGYKLASVKALNTSNAGSVGFAVPEDWITELNKNLMAQTVMAADAKVRQTTSDTIIQPDLTTTDARRAYAANVQWPGESPASPTEFDATEIALGQIQVPIHVMLIRMTQTNSALEDVAFDLQAEITEAFSEATAVAYDTLIWSGNGQGKMRGIVVDTRLNDHASTSVTTVGGYIAAGSTSAITSGDKLKQMFSNLPSGYRSRAKWYCNSDTALLISEMKDGIGRYLWGDERGLNGGLVTELIGRPVIINEFADFVAANAYPLILADLSRGYIIGKRVEFSVRRFDDSQYAEKDQILFLGRARLGGQVVQPAAFKLLKMSAS
jgi:HK97 family phage major capsid protein